MEDNLAQRNATLRVSAPLREKENLRVPTSSSNRPRFAAREDARPTVLSILFILFIPVNPFVRVDESRTGTLEPRIVGFFWKSRRNRVMGVPQDKRLGSLQRVRLQSARHVAAVAELGSLDPRLWI
jgi:hypothetical protein